MINGLIANAGKISRDITMALIILCALVWTINELVVAAEKLREVFNPGAFHEEVMKAEERSKALIASEIDKERMISAAEHREVMGVVSSIDKRTKRIEDSIDTLIEQKTAVLKVLKDSAPN